MSTKYNFNYPLDEAQLQNERLRLVPFDVSKFFCFSNLEQSIMRQAFYRHTSCDPRHCAQAVLIQLTGCLRAAV
jgi:hypothetical protein